MNEETLDSNNEDNNASNITNDTEKIIQEKSNELKVTFENYLTGWFIYII